MINKNFLQATTIGRVVQAGVAKDGHFYTQLQIKNPDPESSADEFINAFVRTHTQEERAAYYEDTRNLSPEEAERDAYIMSARQRKTLDVEGQFTAKIEDAKSNGHFPDTSNKEILENHLGGMMVTLHGISITHKMKDGTAPFDPNDPTASFYVATADKMVVTGLVKDSVYLEDTLNSEAAHTTAEATETMAVFRLSPPENNRPALAEAYEVTDANNINFKDLAGNPAVMDKMIDDNARPFHERSDTFHREGFLQMNIRYTDASGSKKLHRFEFDSGTLDSGEHKYLTEPDLADVASAWDDEHQHDISRFRAMQDPDTLDSVNKDHLAKLDFMRVILLASKEPRKFKDFVDKVNKDDPTAFHGITKTDFFNEPNLSDDQKVILDVVKSMAKDPSKVFMNTAAHSKLNISAALQDAMTEGMSASYSKQNQDRTDGKNNLFGKSTTAQSRITNSGLDVVRTNQFGDVVTVVIPITKVSEVHPKGQYTAVTDQVHAKYKVVLDPRYSQSEGGTSRWKSSNETYTDDKFVPVNLVKSANKSIAFDEPNNLRILDGGKSAPYNEPVKAVANEFSSSLEPFTTNELGRIDVNANYTPNKIEFASPQQAIFAHTNIHRKDKFVDLMTKRQPDPSQAIKRYDEMTEVIQQITGRFSKDNTSHSVYKAVLSQNPNDRDEKTNKVRDMLLGDKLVAVDITDKKTGEVSSKNYNFSDVMAVTLNADKPLRRAITDDIADERADLNQDAMDRFKAERVDQGADKIVERLKESNMTIDAFCDDIEDMAKKPTPILSQSPRV